MSFLDKMLCIAIESDQDILVLKHEQIFFILGWKETVLKICMDSPGDEVEEKWKTFLLENWDGTTGVARQSILNEHEKAVHRLKCFDLPQF